ncbi:MAG: nucleotide exchange factor GrpE [Leptospirales bacterium]
MEESNDPKTPETGTTDPEHLSGDPESDLTKGTTPESENAEVLLWKDKYVRLLADFDNYRKRVNREMDESKKFSNESLLKAFLPILDNLERALFHFEPFKEVTPEVKALTEGVRLTEKQFSELLEKFHVTRIPTRGASFDPNLHEAMGFTPSDEHAEGMVVDVYQQGYLLHNRLLRPSLVTVAQKKEEGTES